jgi:eukaryotic-like serine/threonine-protein kinase
VDALGVRRAEAEQQVDVPVARRAGWGSIAGWAIAAALLVSPGLWSPPVQPVVDPFNFLPRVRLPVEVLSGEYDQVYPLETSARPFYELLGTPEPDKRHYIAQGGPDVPLIDTTRETLDWLDQHLGPGTAP